MQGKLRAARDCTQRTDVKRDLVEAHEPATRDAALAPRQASAAAGGPLAASASASSSLPLPGGGRAASGSGAAPGRAAATASRYLSDFEVRLTKVLKPIYH